MSAHISTKEKLLAVVGDMELISKEIIENLVVGKDQRQLHTDIKQLTELLTHKDTELKEILREADEQAELERKIRELKAEVDKYDQFIVQLQNKFKTAEQILSTSIYQARMKIQSIALANKRPVSSEELIKFAHRISASNAISAPLNWQQGDPRRPYPTDIEMRLGLLGRLSDLPINGLMLRVHQQELEQQQQQQQQHLSEIHQRSSTSRELNQTGHSNQFAWHPSGEMHMLVSGSGASGAGANAAAVSGGNASGVDAHNHHQQQQQQHQQHQHQQQQHQQQHHQQQQHKQDTEDVEVMSTDSSSSSSSDSQ